MRNHRGAIVSIVLLVVAAGCAEPLASGNAAPSAPRPSGSAGWANDALAAALGLQPLKAAELARGEREIRLWPTTGPVIPELFIRVADRRGTATAEVYAYWRDAVVHREPAFARFEARVREGGCGPIQHSGDFGYCVLASASPQRAREMVSYLDSIKAWSSADEDPTAAERAAGRFLIQLDGSGVSVEVRRGRRYDAAVYSARHMTPGSIGRRLFDLSGRF